MVFFKKKPKDPFDVTGLEGLSLEEQERVLTKVASREAEFIEKGQTPKFGKIKVEAEKRIKILEKRKGFSRLRQRLIDSERERKRNRKRISLQGLASTISPRRGLSPFQRNIIRREQILRLIRETPPLERAKVLRGSSEFDRQRDAIRSDITPKRQGTGLVPFENSPAQQAQARFREKVNSAKGRI